MMHALDAGGVAVAARVLPRTLAQAVRERTAQNVYRCYQCDKCTSGCPLAAEFDLVPSQVLRSAQLDDPGVLESQAIWLCASCYICTTRCPQDIDVAAVMKALCVEAKHRNVAPAVPAVDRFNMVFLRIVRGLGRMHEITLVALYALAIRRPPQDLKMGIRMLLRGRLRLVPRIVRPPRKVVRVDGAARKVGYFPGCSVYSHAAEYDHSTRAVARVLNIELVEPRGWVCCGASVAPAADPVMANVRPMRAVSAVERMGLDTVTSPCSACFIRLKASEHKTRHDRETARRVQADTGHAYHGGVKVQHLLDVILERAGLEHIAARIVRPLENLKVACYYGCLMTRPAKLVGDAHPEYPEKMDRLLRALGAEPIAWSSKTDCCGNSLSVSRPPLALEMSRNILMNARDCGAEAIVTMCPFCHTNLDARQEHMKLGQQSPILYATQLMALAFGLGEKAAQLDKSFVDPRPLLEQKKLL